MTAAPAARFLPAANAGRGPWVPQNQLNPGKASAAAAFTSARTATPAPVAQATKADIRPVATLRRAASRHAVRLAAHSEAHRRYVSRRFSAKTRIVSLQRDIEAPAVTGSVDRSAAGAPTGSIPSMVTQMARAAGVSPALAHAVVKVESRYQPRATGRGGYIGLMQLSYRTAQGMGFRGSRQALYEPRNNLTYGMKYLAGAVAKAGGNTCAAVSKYQGGHGVRGVTQAGAVYCAKVKRFMSAGVPSDGRVADATPSKS